MVKLLIENGADVTIKSYGGSTPLSCGTFRKTEVLESCCKGLKLLMT